MAPKPMPDDPISSDSLAHALDLAAAAIAGVFAGRTLDAALAACWRSHPELPSASRGAVQDLAYGALRRYARGDFLLNLLLRQPLREPRLRALLLAALYRLDARPEDGHTTVDQAVAAAGGIARGRFKALANALLRSYLRRRLELEAAADTDEAARYQHPLWWIAALRQHYPAQWREILAASNARPPLTLRVNRRRGDVADLLATFAVAGIAARALDETAILVDRPLPVERLPGFGAGLFSVQDWGAQRAAVLLEAQDGMRVLDACAAPGGKSAHLLELADIELLALDVDPGRAARITGNLERLGLAASIKAADCRILGDWWDGRPFERILADVPCSASGVVRRHPDIKWLRRESDLAGFGRVQAEIVDALWRVLAAGGRMLYCTCSLFPQENAQQLAAFAARHADALLMPTGAGGAPQGQTGWQLTPQAEHDGFFYALLQKRG
ncbi:ribosomal RNA small subunit methyltransferase B [mine drainage metagenome]|uniref:16S rRNA (cytosine(967)-C(5))-methyltransferase n=1 Tax=mine drainage metagenome TaxID=410659 RepID=A0A1J5RN92_9ZZZZ